MRDTLVEFAADVYVEWVDAGAGDPGLVSFIHNRDGLNPFPDAGIFETAPPGGGPSEGGPSGAGPS